MNYFKNTFGITGAALALLVFVSCLISGTFVTTIFIKNLEISPDKGFYYYKVSLAGNSIWEDHKENIKDIDMIGFELWITNQQAESRTFNVYIDDTLRTKYTTASNVEDSAIHVIDNLTLSPSSQTHITYGQSFKYLKNVETLRDLVEEGAFHYYGFSDAGLADEDYTIDSAKVIITFTAGV